MENTTNQPTPNNSNTNQGQNSLPAKNLANAVAVLVLGICSIFPGCFCYGVIGVVCGIIALVLAKKDMAAYNSSPESYNIASFNNLKAGRVCAIIGLSLSSLILVISLIAIAAFGAAVSMMPWSQMK